MAFFRFWAMVISLVVFLCSHCLEIFGFSLILSIYVFFFFESSSSNKLSAVIIPLNSQW